MRTMSGWPRDWMPTTACTVVPTVLWQILIAVNHTTDIEAKSIAHYARHGYGIPNGRLQLSFLFRITSWSVYHLK